jgi:hypothetical protein
MKIHNKTVSLYNLYLKTIKRQYIYSSIENSEVELVSERNNAGLKKLSQVLSEQTSDSSALLNVMCLLTVKSIFHVSIRINRNRISEGVL